MSSTTRRRLPRIVGAVVLLAAGQTSATVSAKATAPLRLTPGRAVFWSGPAGGQSCGISCWDYAVDVRGRGERLRVAIDHATVGDVFDVDITEPNGSGGGGFSPGTGLYSAEFFVSDPAPGLWRFRVTAQDVKDNRFRMRAKLETTPKRPGRKVTVPPNLQALPPYDFTFMMPLTNGSTGGAPQGVDTPGGRLACHPEEVAEESAVRCLRMAFGVRNTGQGPMQLFYDEAGADLLTDRTLYQRVRYSDGNYADRTAGKAHFHKTHGHYHHQDAVALHLFRADGNRLEQVGVVHPKGFAHRSEMLREWRNFYPTWPDFGFGLRPGWGDYYEWDRPGNYIDLGVSGDGTYVVRITADPGNGIVESNDRDNVSYSYFRLSGTTVTLLESGRGTDPWDRCRILTPFGAEPNVTSGPQPRRPRDCPPDTT